MKKLSLILLVVIIGITGCKDKGKEVEVPKTLEEVIIEGKYWQVGLYTIENDTVEHNVDTLNLEGSDINVNDMHTFLDKWDSYYDIKKLEYDEQLDAFMLPYHAKGSWAVNSSQDTLLLRYLSYITYDSVYSKQKVLSYTENQFVTTEVISDSLHTKTFNLITDESVRRSLYF